jgi:dihydroxyacetone kinase-like protein
MVNNLGGTPKIEMYCMLKYCAEILREKHSIEIERVLLGDIMTSLDMKGVSFTLLHLAEDKRCDILEGTH